MLNTILCSEPCRKGSSPSTSPGHPGGDAAPDGVSALTTCSKARSNSSSNRTACRMPLKAVCCCSGSSAKGRKLLSKGRVTGKAASTPGLRTAVRVSEQGQQLLLFIANCPQFFHRHFQLHSQSWNSEIKDIELNATHAFFNN